MSEYLQMLSVYPLPRLYNTHKAPHSSYKLIVLLIHQNNEYMNGRAEKNKSNKLIAHSFVRRLDYSLFLWLFFFLFELYAYTYCMNLKHIVFIIFFQILISYLILLMPRLDSRCSYYIGILCNILKCARIYKWNT
jgi:hypothetical protein